ncbi:MAG: tRNA (guanine10-N2)-dimethyltransferase [Thermoproteota archaeon]|nr:tRNA (guanine10-N2)-dimethyltransferase [Thermoproteota archaeon]
MPYSEIIAILEAEGFLYENEEIFPQLLCLKSNVKCIPSVSYRASFLKDCGIEIFRCRAEENEITRKASEENSFGRYLLKGQTFSVRIKKVETGSSIDTGKIERIIGKAILEKTKYGRVQLSNPNISFLGVLTNNLLIFGLKNNNLSLHRNPLRRPKSRPFFHPSIMMPKLARCMVNLARVNSSSLVLDPFCGTGSILLEAGLIGCEIVGSDLSLQMVKGSRQNLEYFKIQPASLLIADAKCLPFHKIARVVTDPPYGITSSTFKRYTKTIISEFLFFIADILMEGGYVAISIPNSIKIKEICETLNYRIVEQHSLREHRSLTREIIVLQKL